MTLLCDAAILRMIFIDIKTPAQAVCVSDAAIKAFEELKLKTQYRFVKYHIVTAPLAEIDVAEVVRTNLQINSIKLIV